MAPLDLSGITDTVRYALLFGLIGFGFGFVLELTGFGNSRKLAAQFYLHDMTVLKAMFTGIVVAAVLVYAATAFGLLDISRVWVNPTFLWPAIVGGLVMGVGFVVGGFCPGTSLVAAATGKLDGIAFVAGALAGVGLFGETVSSFETFFVSGNMGRFTLPDWLGLPTGTVVVLVVAMALAMFVGAEAIERWKSVGRAAEQGRPVVLGRFRRIGAAALAASALMVAVRGQPDAEARFARSPALQKLVAERAVFVDPAEVVALRKDLNLRVDVLDLRAEAAYNLFHLAHARRADAQQLADRDLLRALQDAGPTTVTFLVGSDEAQTLAVWRDLRTQGVTNLYIVDGGVDRWLDLYPVPACVATRVPRPASAGFTWDFRYASGASLPSAFPELSRPRSFDFPCDEGSEGEAAPSELREEHRITWPEHPYTKRVKLQTKTLVKGGCG